MSYARLRILLTTLLLAVSCVASSAAYAQDDPLTRLQKQQREIFEEVAPAVVYIAQDEGVGSGFFVSSDGVILTNLHVIGDRKKVSVVLRDGRKTTGTVIARATQKYDLALLKVPIDDTPSIPLAGMDDVRVGNWAGAVGHSSGTVWTYTTGMVSNIYTDDEGRTLLQTQIPINFGNSGGPVVDTRGHAIGVATAVAAKAENLNFAIPVEMAVKKMDALTKRCDCLVVEAPEGTPIFVDGVMVGKGPRVIISAERKTYDILVTVDGKPQRRKVDWPKTREVDMAE